MGDPVAVLLEAAIRCLEDSLRVGSERTAAAPLLAADALLTYTLEASAEQGASLDELSAELNRRLAALIEG
jgi:hypothetical protein